MALLRRFGASGDSILAVQGNIACTYQSLGRLEDASRIEKDVYSGYLKLKGGSDEDTLLAALNYVSSLAELKRFKEAKTLLRKTMPVARRVVGENHDLTLKMRGNYGGVLLQDPCATLDDLREAVTTFEETARTARRVFGGEHPFTVEVEGNLRNARVALRAAERRRGPRKTRTTLTYRGRETKTARRGASATPRRHPGPRRRPSAPRPSAASAGSPRGDRRARRPRPGPR